MKKNNKSLLLLAIILVIAYYSGGSKYIDQLAKEVTNSIVPNSSKNENDKQLVGKIIDISDGDTCTLLDNNGKKHKIRLNGIDAPEIGQKYGKESKAFLEQKALNKFASIEVIDIDQYNRTLGVIIVDNVDINKAMLRNGYAWQYRFNNDAEYSNLIKQAKQERLNIWSEQSPIDPYIWRKQNK